MAAAAPDTWMPLWIGPYLANTLHLNRSQHGSYCLLIMACWKAGGRLPNNDAMLATIARCTAKEWKAEREIFAAFFTVDDECWAHDRVLAELEKARGFVDRQRQNGAKGGRPRNPDKTQTKPTAKPNSNPDETTTPSPTQRTVSDASSVSDSAREDGGDSGWEPEGVPTAEVIVPRFQAAAGRAAGVGPDWLPSEETQRSLARARPDLTPARIQQRTAEFRAWCAETNKQSHNFDATWFNFMVKTHAERDDRPTAAAGQRSPELAGIAAARARRSVLAGN